MHTHKTLRKLERRGLHQIINGRLHLRDPKALARLADLYGDGQPAPRPLVQRCAATAELCESR